MHLSLQVPHAGFLEFTFGVFVFLFFTLLCQEVTSSFFMFLRKCDQMTKISICFYLGRISLRYLIPVYVRFFFFFFSNFSYTYYFSRFALTMGLFASWKVSYYSERKTPGKEIGDRSRFWNVPRGCCWLPIFSANVKTLVLFFWGISLFYSKSKYCFFFMP